MTSPETQTNNIEAKPWSELENPVNYIGTPYLDETTVPEEKKPLYDTVLAAHHSAIDQEREDAAAAEQAQVEAQRQAFLQERQRQAEARRQKALERIDEIAIHGAMEKNIADQQLSETPVYHTTPDGTLLSDHEVEDMRQAREMRSQL